MTVISVDMLENMKNETQLGYIEYFIPPSPSPRLSLPARLQKNIFRILLSFKYFQMCYHWSHELPKN